MDYFGSRESLPKEVIFKLKTELQEVMSCPHKNLETERLKEQPMQSFGSGEGLVHLRCNQVTRLP